jgi:sugar O-acyltransferase (sialic acid O-acetyltransferase NeuD family)
MSRELLIYGAGGAGRDLDFFLSVDKNPKTAWKIIGFIDDTQELQGKIIYGLPVLGGFEYLENYSGNLVVSIVDKPAVRRNLILKIKQNKNIRFPVVFNSASLVSPYAKWGEGCIITGPYAAISPGVKLGEFVYLCGGNNLEPDVTIGDYSTVFPGVILGSGVSIGSECLVGSGAIILPNIKIGRGTIIGSSSLVAEDVPPNVVVAGNPAKIIKKY